LKEKGGKNMVNCSVKGCKEKIAYLPFKCKYCAKIYCSKHRLPESHDCEGLKEEYGIRTLSIENVNPEVKVNDPSEHALIVKPAYNAAEYDPEETERERREREAYYEKLRRQRLPRNQQSPSHGRSGPAFLPNGKMNATYMLMVLTIIFYIFSHVDVLIPYLFLNSDYFFTRFYFWTLFTAMFITGGLFGLIIRLIILYLFGRIFERQFGPKFMAGLYILSGLICGIVAVSLQFIFSLTVDPTVSSYAISSSGGMGIAFIALYVLLFGPNTEMNLLIYFIPIRLKTIHVYYVFVGFEIVWLIIGLASGSYVTVAMSVGNISSTLAGIIMFKQLTR